MIDIRFGRRIWRRMHKDAEAQPKLLTRLYCHSALFTVAKRVAPERIRHNESVIASMKPARPKILRVAEQRHPNFLAGDGAAEIAPLRSLAADLFSVLSARRVQNRAVPRNNLCITARTHAQ